MQKQATLLKDIQDVSVRQKCLKTLKVMLLSRYSDEKMGKLVRQNKGGTFHMNALGHELIGAVSALSLQSGKDWGLPYYRDRAFAIGLGCDMTDLMGAFLARAVPHHSGGRMMPDHFSHKQLRIPVQSSVVGSQFLHAVGIALSAKLRGSDEVVYVSAGDGATSQGDFHEALNFSCVHQLPVIFVIQDNGWAISVPVKDQTAGGSAAKMASGFEGLTIHDIDGTDFETTSEALKSAVEKGRQGKGPSLIVAKVPRMGPHSSSDDPKKYKDETTILEEQANDPIGRFESWLIDMGLATEAQIAQMHEDAKRQIEEATKEGEKIPFPSDDTILDHVFKQELSLEEVDKTTDEDVVIVDAINHGLHEEMQKDASVIVFGQDVAFGKGGVFGATRGLTDIFGKERCFNTPLAESTIVGVATGLAMTGFHKPVVEIQFADYFWTSVNQLFNELASVHYRSDGQWHCPIVIRMPYGGYIQGGPYHSQSIEAFLAHCPGLKVVIPSNASDAKRLLKAAIRDPNPVVILEHKGLYRQRFFACRKEPTPDAILPLGKANIMREGEDITVVCYGMMAFMAHEAAEKLSDEGISVELIDIRTLVPLDMETIKNSVKKTSKLLIIHEAAKSCGFGAEISARITESIFHHLDAPIARLCGLECATPYAKNLENAALPQKEQVIDAMRSLSQY